MKLSYNFPIRRLKSIQERLERIIREAPPKAEGNPDYIYLDSHDLSALFMVSLYTIRNWRQANLIPCVRMGKKAFYRVSDLQRVIEENLVGNSNNEIPNSKMKSAEICE